MPMGRTMRIFNGGVIGCLTRSASFLCITEMWKSIGAQRVQRACISFRNFCDEQNVEWCIKCLQQVKHEYLLVKNKLENLFELQRQVVQAGGSLPR